MIETLWYPWMINRLFPWHVYSILKARLVPLITFWRITSYALGLRSDRLIISNMFVIDMFCSTAIQVTYLVHMSLDQATPSDIVWLLPSLLWFFLMSPGIVVWSLLTIWDDSWGNVPRAIRWRSFEGKETSDGWIGSDFFQRFLKMKHVGFQILWIIIVLAAFTRALLSL